MKIIYDKLLFQFIPYLKEGDFFQISIKNIAGNNTTINCDYSLEAIIPSNGYSEVSSVTIGAGSCIFVNDGFSWIQFNCN